MKICVPAFLILLLLANFAEASVTRFQEMDSWSSGMLYPLGSVVREGDDIFVSLLPSKNKKPSSNPLVWAKVNLSRQLSFKPLKMYAPSQVVAHAGRYYLARRVSVLPNSKYLDKADHRWLQFSHPGLIHNIPPNPGTAPELDTILGADSNNNGVRDDFEREIIYSSLPNSVVISALDAGRIYGRVMTLASSGVDSSPATVQLAIDWIRSEQCRQQLQMTYEGATWARSTYYNSIPRIEALHQVSNAMAKVVDINILTIPDDDPCVALSATR